MDNEINIFTIHEDTDGIRKVASTAYIDFSEYNKKERDIFLFYVLFQLPHPMKN